jgi:pimeloyl-ACP methyl ester carboxylesterase
LITHLPSYLPASVPAPSAHLVLGVSLGGHAAWHALAADARVSAGVVVIGCPDFARLMAHRASKSRLPEWGDGAGERFFGSAAFPDALVAALEGADPAARLLPLAARATSLPPLKAPSDGALVPPVMRGVAARMNRAFGGKAILNLAGGKDKLVPYANSEPFLKFLKRAVDPEDGWWREGGLHFEDRVFAGAGHELTPEMAVEAVRFIGDVLEGKIKTQADGGLKSKM